MADLSDYQAKSDKLVPVWTIEIQTLPKDTDRLLDAVRIRQRYRQNRQTVATS